MSEINPILLLILGLLELGLGILWGLSIYVTVRTARRAGRRVWPWTLLAVGLGFVSFGPLYLCAGYLARSRRRSPAGWAAAQVVFAGGVIALSAWQWPQIRAAPLLLGLAALVAAALLVPVPLIVLSLLPPRPAAPLQTRDDRPLIQAERLQKSYRLGKRDLHVLRGVSLTVRRGEFVAILGASGSGKSTLLHLLGLLDAPDSGRLVVDGADTQALKPAERDRFRAGDVGFVFQFYHLLPELNVLENTLLPAMTSVGPLAWPGARGALRKRATDILQRLGLGDRLDHRPRQLSGGEQQRVAIARALMNSPKLLLADEPTGNLDSRTGGEILRLLRDLNARNGQTIVMVTHDASLAEAASRVLHLRDGLLR